MSTNIRKETFGGKREKGDKAYCDGRGENRGSMAEEEKRGIRDLVTAAAALYTWRANVGLAKYINQTNTVL